MKGWELRNIFLINIEFNSNSLLVFHVFRSHFGEEMCVLWWIIRKEKSSSVSFALLKSSHFWSEIAREKRALIFIWAINNYIAQNSARRMPCSHEYEQQSTCRWPNFWWERKTPNNVKIKRKLTHGQPQPGKEKKKWVDTLSEYAWQWPIQPRNQHRRDACVHSLRTQRTQKVKTNPFLMANPVQ